MASDSLQSLLPFLDPQLRIKLAETCTLMSFPADTEILREGQYIKVVPLVLKGLVKVVAPIEDKELLLYYIQPAQSCVLTLSASLSNLPSNVVARTMEESQLLLIPGDMLPSLLQEFPSFNRLFYELYNTRYTELVDTIRHLVFDTLDTRLLAYLQEQSARMSSSIIKFSHRQIAEDLGTSREVISRVMKKLEKLGKVVQTPDGIEIL